MKAKIVRHDRGETIELRDEAGALQYQINVPLYSSGWLEIIAERGDIAIREDTSNCVKVGTSESDESDTEED